MVSAAGGQWDSDIVTAVSAAMTPLADSIASAVESLPPFSMEAAGLKAFQNAVVQQKVSELAAQLTKKVDAATACCKLAGISTTFIESFSKAATSGLTAVATLSVGLLLSSESWKTMTPEHLKVADSKEDKLYKSLCSNDSFVKSKKLTLPEDLLSKMQEKITAFSGATAAGAEIAEAGNDSEKKADSEKAKTLD